MKKTIQIAIILLGTVAMAQSPWTQKKGKVYTQLSYTSIANYSALFGKEDIKTDREVSDNTLQFYGEYGITGKTTLLVNIPLKLVSTGKSIAVNPINTEASKTSLGNINIGIKHNFSNKKWLVSAQLNIEANTSKLDELSGLRTGYDAYTVTPVISVGRGYNDWYIQSHLGIDIKTNGYSSGLKGGGEIGYKAHKKIWLVGFLDVKNSFKNGNRIETPTNLTTGLYINNQQYVAFGGKIIGEFTKNFGGTASFGGAFFGRNVAKQAALSIGLYHKF